MARLFLADFDADRFPDFIVEGDDNSVVQNTEQSLGPRVVLGSRGMLRAGDVDEDGKLDAITALPQSRGNVLLLRRGLGGFTFAPEETVGVAAGEVRGFEITDFDGDGHLDLAVAEAAVAILRGLGDGRFVTRSSFPMPYRTGALACADLDGDGDRDLAVAMPLQRAVSTLWNRGDGWFESKTTFGAHDSPAVLCVADADGDGDLDLFTGNEYLGTGACHAAATLLLNETPQSTPVTLLEAETRMGAVILRWSLPPGATLSSARVQRASAATGPWMDLPPLREGETYEDRNVEPGAELWYRVLLRATNGVEIVLGPCGIHVPEAATVSFFLQPVVTPATSESVQIDYEIGGRSAVTRLAIYDSRGALAWGTASGRQSPGEYCRFWDRHRAARGVNFVRLSVDTQSVTRRVLLLRR